MAWRRKALIIIFVCFAHAALLYLVNSQHKTLKAGAGFNILNDKVPPQAIAVDFITPMLPSPATHLPPAVKAIQTTPFSAQKQVNKKTSVKDSPVTSDFPDSPPSTPLQGISSFLTAEELDKTAEPEEKFDEFLAENLPLIFGALEIEFWIDGDGHTLQVICISGDCDDTVLASLSKLNNLTFKPAQKNGQSVPSRKLIQINTAPTFGL